MNSDTSLDDCNCCTGLADPPPVSNDPGLPALRYRVDTQPGFYARMLQSLPIAPAEPDEPDAPRPLAKLLTRSPDDPTVALVDAAACVADVLSFYQERIANEGFLRTATERRSVLELARAIGYELKPGVAASVYLSFTVEDAPGAPGVVTLAAGTAIQSIPPQGKLPQVFETGDDLVAHAEWNALVPRQLRPADMAIIDVPGTGQQTTRKALVLLGPAGSFPAETPDLHTGLVSASLYRLDPGLAVDATVDAIEVGRVYFTDATTGIAVGDLLLFVAKRSSDLVKLVMRAVAVTPETSLKRLRVDFEALPDPVTPLPPPIVAFTVPYALKPVLSFAKPLISAVSFTGTSITTTVVNQAWRESDLQAMIGIQGWSSVALVQTIATQPSGPPVAPEAGAFAFGAKVGFFGNNGPKWAILPNSTNTNGTAYESGWDANDAISGGGTLSAPRTVWTDSQGNAISPSAYLERAVPGIARGSWTVFDAPEATAQVYGVFDAREASRADYGLSGRATALTLAGDDGNVLTPKPTTNFPFRSTTAYVASRQLALADLPIDQPVAAGDTSIELDGMVLGLTIGQPIALVGERDDLPGVSAAEVALLQDIVHADGRSTLVLQQGLTYSYVRAGLVISANVVHATHGETVNEMLGSGDASQANQSFVLKKPPTTFLSAPTASGVQSTLEVRVGGVRWDERPSLYDAAPNDLVYTTRIADDATMTVTFGDGTQGARLPTGSVNVAATYRSGIGPDGEVDAGTLTMLRAQPLGLRSVTNPIAASGAEGPEQLADARRNAPLTLLTFERVVSLLDYENYARAYPGIGKARGDVLWVDGASMVYLTVAGATGGAPGSDALANLQQSIAGASDPAQRFVAAAYVQRYFTLSAQLAVDPRYRFADVQAAVQAAVLSAFGFDARDLGQSVTAAEIMALVHTVPGVVAIDIVELLPYADDAQAVGASLDAVPAFGARYDTATKTQTPAELLLVNPAGVTLTEMTP
ncbi:MAG: putative baseplate assembly protein [Proteobacteria bacterium]|nr:putative baseplate assembly protein [Pseudomonadota bacterium]